jgi:hypothetical protein
MRLPKHKFKESKLALKKKRESKPKAETSSTTIIEMERETLENNEADLMEEEDLSSTNGPIGSVPKSKEEKARIRAERLKRNRAKNFFKHKSGNITGKNGPRAVNRASLT